MNVCVGVHKCVRFILLLLTRAWALKPAHLPRERGCVQHERNSCLISLFVRSSSCLMLFKAPFFYATSCSNTPSSALFLVLSFLWLPLLKTFLSNQVNDQQSNQAEEEMSNILSQKFSEKAQKSGRRTKSYDFVFARFEIWFRFTILGRELEMNVRKDALVDSVQISTFIFTSNEKGKWGALVLVHK